MHQQELHRLLPPRDVVLPAEGLVAGIPLLDDLAPLGDEAARRAVERRVQLLFLDEPLRDEEVHEGEPFEVQHLGVGLGDVGPTSDGEGRGIPDQDLWVDVQRRHHRLGRELLRRLNGVVGRDVAEEDLRVLVHERRDRLKADERTAEADLDRDAGRAERPAVGAVLLVDGASRPDQLI